MFLHFCGAGHVPMYSEKNEIPPYFGKKNCWPWQDSNLQSPDPKSGALSIRPHGLSDLSELNGEGLTSSVAIGWGDNGPWSRSQLESLSQYFPLQYGWYFYQFYWPPHPRPIWLPFYFSRSCWSLKPFGATSSISAVANAYMFIWSPCKIVLLLKVKHFEVSIALIVSKTTCAGRNWWAARKHMLWCDRFQRIHIQCH